MGEERRKSDLLIKAILFLLGILQTIITAWCYRVSAQTESNATRITTMEERVSGIKSTLEEVKQDVKILVRRVR